MGGVRLSVLETDLVNYVAISGRGLLAWMSGLTVVAYFSGAAALWIWLDQRPYNNITYTDLILPTRWSEIEKLRGRALVAEGMDDIKAARWGAGLAKLRTGVARNPDEIEGRIVLADLFTAMKARKQVIEVYDGGLATKYPGRTYLEAMIKSAALSEDYAWWLRTCDRALALVAGHPELAGERKWIVQQKIAGLLASEQPEAALALADTEGETGSPAVSELRVLALLKAGKPDESLSYLKSWAERVGPNVDLQVLRLQVRAYREARNPAAMDQAVKQLCAQTPTDPRPYIYGIVQLLLAERRSDADSSLDAFLLRFGSQVHALQMLAMPLAEISERPMLEQLVAYAQRQGFDADIFRRLLVQSLVNQADWVTAAAVLAEVQDSPKNSASETAWRVITHAQIQAALDPADGVQSNLVTLVRKRQFTVVFYKDLITNLRKAGRTATAREIITYAQGIYPQNASIEAARKQLDDELAASEAAKPVIKLTRPAQTEAIVPASARKVELVEADFFTRLDELTKAGDFEGALKHLREARFAKPSWLDAREAELSRNEVRFSGRVGDMPGLRSAVRLFNNGDRVRSAQLIEIAREFNAANHRDEALLLLKELLAKTPDLAIAKRLIAEWAPKPADKTP
jgi:hypothetical protein